jgi:hypothetical protein
MKKLLSIILAITMLLTLAPMAFAFDGDVDYTIEPYETISVTASASNNPVIKFVPEETRSYIVASFAEGEVDPYCDIETGDGLSTTRIDDTSGGDVNFYEFIEFEAGMEYYFTIYTYSEEDETFDFAILCAHIFEDATCTICDYVCDHTTEGKRFVTCDCGQVSKCGEIKLGETQTLTFNGTDPIYLSYTPTEDVTAIFYSSVGTGDAARDVCASVYDANRNEIAYSDDFAGNLDFLIWNEYTAGETYFFEIGTFYEDADVVFTFDYAVHTTEDGETHDITYVEEYYSESCVEMGYAEGLYCADCDEYLAGHEETDYGFCWDEDWDDYCDNCGEPIVYEDDDIDTEENILTTILNVIMLVVNFIINILASLGI